MSCDYLALVGVKQVLRTLRRVTEQTGRPVRVAGVLPTFYDVRNKLCLEALTYLRKTFGAQGPAAGAGQHQARRVAEEEEDHLRVCPGLPWSPRLHPGGRAAAHR